MRSWLGVLLLSIAVPAVAAPAPTLDQIVARNIEARGGLARIKALRSLRLVGTAVFGGSDSRVEAEWAWAARRPGLARTEVSLQGLTAIDAWDGQQAWSVQPFEGRRDAQRASADDAKDTARDAEIDGPLVDWREKGHRLEYLGTEDVDGTPAHKLRVVRKDGDTQYVYLDPDHWLEIRVVTESRVRGVERVSETDLGAYAAVDGVLIPMSRESGPKGVPRGQRITVTRAEANVALDDALFRMPAAGPAMVRAVVPGPAAAAPLPPSPAAAPPASPPPSWTRVFSPGSAPATSAPPP